MSSTSLTIERYAEIRAEMEVGRPRDEVLARAGLGVDAWTTEQRSWLQKMSAELERGRFELTNRYTKAFLERQSAFQAKSPSLAEAQPAKARAEAPTEGPGISPPPAAAPSAALSVEDIPELAWLARLPAGTDIEKTLPPIELADPPKTLPFRSGTTPSELAAPPRATNAQPFREDNVEDEASRTLPPHALARPALPFPRSQDEDEDNRLGRNEDDEGAAGRTRPFAKAKPPAHSPEAEGDDSKIPARPRAPVQELSLESHALLCAELAHFPGNAEEIFAKYGLASPEKRRAVDEAWKERLRREPTLYREWQQLYRMFHARWTHRESR